ncbi:MAG: SDR family NAD(P)-dependent oxidoreductase [Thermoanaerobaculia bacterium]|nr:SDR family NAD(P)-dependent oxidoreductase [Thermoanaerobaculia bacterium]
MSRARVAVVTGASSGIGEATARKLAASGFDVIIGARRLNRLQQIAREIGGRALFLDVTDRKSVELFAADIPAVDLLVNNAGGALGADTIEEADEARWEWMFQANVMGVLRVTKALLPQLEASGDGLIINVGSIAGFETYPGGGGYTAAKHGLRALTQTLRQELLGRPIRISELCPGLAETEFSIVRFDGDSDRARKVYDGMTPLTADDLAEAIRWIASLPSHVNIDQMVVRPRDQATALQVHRTPPS